VQREARRLQAAQAPSPPELRDVPLNELALGDSTQARARLDQAVMDAYAEAIQRGDTFPPVVLFWDGALYSVGDGHHRIGAARKVGFTTITAEVRAGGQREALLYACSANARHGHPRTDADKRRAVETLLQDAVWGKWSDNHIARHCSVAVSFVGRVRRSLFPENSDDDQRTYLRNGQERTMHTAGIGTRTPPTPTHGMLAQPTRPPASPIRLIRHWYNLVEGLQVVLSDFAIGGGLEPLLAVWSENERARAQEQLRQYRHQLECLEAALSGADHPEGQDAALTPAETQP
jgi:hypothetical protein